MRNRRGKHAKPPSRRGAHVTLLIGLFIIAAGAGGFIVARAGAGAPYVAGPAPKVAIPSGRTAALPAPTSDPLVPLPTMVIIPAIGVRANLVRLGLTSQESMRVPTSTSVAGWFTHSPRPGAIGSAIIAGHVDSTAGPGAFFRLRLLHPGDRVYIRRADGSLAVFDVAAVRFYAKVHFPATGVYGPVPAPALRLITCGGTFDYATRSYLDSVVAYAVEVATSGHVGPHGNGTAS